MALFAFSGLAYRHKTDGDTACESMADRHLACEACVFSAAICHFSDGGLGIVNFCSPDGRVKSAALWHLEWRHRALRIELAFLGSYRKYLLPQRAKPNASFLPVGGRLELRD